MTAPRKPLWPKILATVVVVTVLVILYPFTLGPWTYFERRFNPPHFIKATGDVIIETPSVEIMNILPGPIGEWYLRYALWWMRAAKD